MSAITAALSQIDRVAAEGDLVPDPAAPLELETAGEPILLPDGKRIYPPCLHGQPIDELALALLDMHDPAQSTFLRLIGPPGAGKSQIARAIAYRLWTGRGREVADRHGAPFYGFVELQPGPSSDEFFFRYDYVPVAGRRRPGGAGRLGVRAGDARGVGGDDRRGQHRPRRRAAVDQRHPRRAPHACTWRRPARPSSPSPGSRSCSPTTRGWSARPTSPTRGTRGSPRRSRSRATGRRSRSSARRAPLVAEAMRLDRQRIAGEDGLCWTPQFRDIESLWRMSERVGERAALAFFASNLHEQVQAGKIQDAEAAAACRMLDQAGYGRLPGLGEQRPAEPARLPAGGDLMTPASRQPARGRRCSCSSCTAPPRSAAGSTPSTRTSPTTGRRSFSACTRCGR